MKKVQFIFLFLSFFTGLAYADFIGKVIDLDTQKPIVGAIITIDGKVTHTDGYGKFTILDKTESIAIRAYGYDRREFKDLKTKNFGLKSFTPKALYLSYWAVSLEKNINRILKLIDETEANTVVIDTKSEYGHLAYKGNVALAKKIGAYKRTTIKNIDKLITRLKAKGIYLIARHSVFKDNLLAKKRPNFAIKTKQDKVWINREKLAWSDPFVDEVHKYNVELAKEIASKGFDEINFDYIRFPGKARLKYKLDNNEKNRVNAISSFLKLAKEELKPYNIFISADTFGYACWNSNDIKIGHSLKEMEKYVDYIAPMLYPSGFHTGIANAKNPMEKPYEIINHSLKEAKRRFKIASVRFRPWLQSFKDYAFDRRHFGAKELRAQINASEDFGSNGWMLWNSGSKFSKKGLKSSKIERTEIALNDL